MIHVFVGENGFARDAAIATILKEHDGEVRRIDGTDVRVNDLAEIMAGATLFDTSRVIIIDELSASKDTWAVLHEWLDKIDDATTLILIEPKPDKRLVTYRELHKRGLITEFAMWDQKSRHQASRWTKDYAAEHGLELSPKQAETIADRLDWNQWRIHHAIMKLAPLGTLHDDQLNDSIEASPHENVFELLSAAVAGDYPSVERILHSLEQTDDPYRVMGLLSSQVLQLTALVLAGGDTSEVARDIKQSPYALRGLQRAATTITKQQAIHLVEHCAQVDYEMKSSGIDPWLLIKQFLLRAV